MNIKKYNQDEATVCANNTCVTVHGETARLINVIALVAVFFVCAAAVYKAIK